MDGIILRDVVVKNSRVEYFFETRGIISEYFTTDHMFIEYDTDISDVPVSLLTIPFVSSIIPLMWLTNTVMWVTEIDRTFYEALKRIKDAYQNLYNDCSLRGNFVAAKLVDNTYEPETPGLLLFSGGIDAHTTYLRIRDLHPRLLNIQGWYPDVLADDPVADADRRDILAFAEREQVAFSFAKSNFARLIRNDIFQKKLKKQLGDSWWHGFQHSMSFISIAIPLAYHYRIKEIYIASSVPMGEYVKCASHVTTDSEFSFAGVGRCIHDGSELTRQDKVHLIVKHVQEIGGDYPIRVCSFNDKNCCACDKCFRSIVAIVAEGGDIEKFGFHIDAPLKEYFSRLMQDEIVKFNISGESRLHWPATKKRMIENYDNIKDHEFVDWFLHFDFAKQRKKAIRRYYRKNFFSILKRKLHL